MVSIGKCKDWAPRVREELKTPEDYMTKMCGVGKIGSKVLYFNPIVSTASAVILWGFVIYAMVEKEDANDELQSWQAWITDIWTWLYMGSQNFWILVLLYLVVKHWNLKFGKETAEDDPAGKPEFTDLTWFALIFSCGVATGMWYYTAEPMWHYEGYGTGRWMDMEMFNLNTRAEHSLMITYFHWGLHGWIPYATIGALISLGTYRRGWPMSMRWTLYPLIGENVYGILGDAIEILSVLCTVFGVTTSLALGAMQLNKGLLRLDRQTYRGVDDKPEGAVGIKFDQDAQTWIIVAVTIMATGSVVLGLKKGIKALANIAFGMSFFLIMSVLFLDEPWYILNAITSSFGYLLWYMPKVAFHTDAWEMLKTSSHGLGAAPDNEGGGAGWMTLWTIFYWGWWISWGPFVGVFLARISKNRRLGPFIVTSLILPSMWCVVFLGVVGAAQIRITNQAITATQDCAAKAGFKTTDACYTSGGCDGCKFTYGSTANKTKFGWYVPQKKPKTGPTPDPVWTPVHEGVVKLYNLGTEDVLFEHLQYYGGKGWAFFTTIFALIAITLYFVTSSDSASFVVDMMAANGAEDPPLVQKVFWAFTEGAVAIALLQSADEKNPTSAINAVKALPIVLGLPYTFHLFWCCQSLLIMCAEESGKIPIVRKNFSTFLIFNLEPMSFVSFIAPFVPLGLVCNKTWGGSTALYMLFFALGWLFFVALIFLGIADSAFYQMAGAAWFCFGVLVGAVRTGVRGRLGITGDIITDIVVGIFYMPLAVGQMAAEDFSAVAAPAKVAVQDPEPVTQEAAQSLDASQGPTTQSADKTEPKKEIPVASV